MALYANHTEVSADKSLQEIKRTVERYGADLFTFGERPTEILLGFRLKGRMIRMRIPLPNPDDRQYAYKRPYVRRSQAELRNAIEKETRRRWRVLLLMLKAKLEAAHDDSGMATVDTEFGAYLMLPTGQTVAEWLAPQLDEVYETGRMPRDFLALPSGGGR